MTASTPFNIFHVPSFRSCWSDSMASYLIDGINRFGVARIQHWVEHNLDGIKNSWGDDEKIERVGWMLRKVFTDTDWVDSIAAELQCPGKPIGQKAHVHPLSPEPEPLELEPFDECDWYAFSGCESNEPHICYLSSEIVVLVDDNRVNVIVHDFDENIENYAIRDFSCTSVARETARALIAAYEKLDYEVWLNLVFAAIGKLS